MMSQQDGEPPRPNLVHGVTTLEKAAQGGHGLQTVGVDLGILGGRNNVDDEIRRQSGSSSGFSASSGTGHSTSSGSRQSSSSGSGFVASSSGGGQQHSSSYNTRYSSGTRAGSTSGFSQSSQGNTYDDDEYEDEEDIEDDNDGSQGNSYSTHSRSSYSWQSSDPNNPQFKHYRTTRDVTNVNRNGLCESAHCVNVRCVVGPLEKNTGAEIALRMRLVAHTLNKVSIRKIPILRMSYKILCINSLEVSKTSSSLQWQ